MDRLVYDAGPEKRDRRFATAWEVGALLFTVLVISASPGGPGIAVVVAALLGLGNAAVTARTIRFAKVQVYERTVRGTFHRNSRRWWISRKPIPYELIVSADMQADGLLTVVIENPKTFAREVRTARIPPDSRERMALLTPLFTRRPPGLSLWDLPGFGSPSIPPGVWDDLSA
jgi:hypothetical protein